jgi:hypothetical protein
VFDFRSDKMIFALFVSILIQLGASPSAIRAGAQTSPNVVQNDVLPSILKATGEYCEIVKRLALNFICKERVDDRENFFMRGPGSTRNSPDEIRISKVNRRSFTYDFQIIKKGDDVQERRTLLEENGKKRHRENADPPTLKFSARNLVFGPVGFLSRYWQEHFHYEIVGRELADGKSAIIIRAVPFSEAQENNNHGLIWVEAATYQILRIEFEPKDVQGSDVAFEAGNTAIDAKYIRHLSWTVDYGVEKSGVRFPSRQNICEYYKSDTGFKITKREILYEYTDYKYFTVEVEIK